METNKDEKKIKTQKTGVIKKNKYDTAASKVHAKHGTTGDGPKKTVKVKKR